MTPATVSPVPNKPKTPQRTVRVSDEVWKAAQDKAAEKGETVTDVIVRALKRYGKIVTLTSSEAAEVAGVSEGVLRKWVLRGLLEPVRRGAKPLRFDYDAVAECQRKVRPKAWEARHGEAVKAFACALKDGLER